jgi:hypothetical protein
MPVHTVHLITTRIQLQQSVAERLAAAYGGLEVMEYALRELAFLDREAPFPGCDTAQLQVVQARAALARAPSLVWPISGPPPVLALADVSQEVAAHALLSLADALVLSLVETADQAAHPADHAACLAASLPVERAFRALWDAVRCFRNDPQEDDSS